MAARGEKVPEVRIEAQQPKVLSKAEAMLRKRPPPQSHEDNSDEEYVEDRGEEDDGLPNPATTLPGNFIGPVPPPKPLDTAAAANRSTAAGVVSGNLAGMPQAMLGASTSHLSRIL